MLTYNFTYQQLVDYMERSGCNLACCAIERMMIIVEEETGDFPNWDDIAPNWVVEKAFNHSDL